MSKTREKMSKLKQKNLKTQAIKLKTPLAKTQCFCKFILLGCRKQVQIRSLSKEEQQEQQRSLVMENMEIEVSDWKECRKLGISGTMPSNKIKFRYSWDNVEGGLRKKNRLWLKNVAQHLTKRVPPPSGRPWWK